MKKKPVPPAKRPPAKKPAPAKKTPAKKRAGGGVVTKTTQTSTVNQRTTINPGATLLLSDAQYSAAVVTALKDAFSAESIVAQFQEMLEATMESKHGIPMIDHRTRLAALEKLVHIVVGKPIDRVQQIESTVWSWDEIDALIAHSRTLRDGLREMLRPYDEADREEEKPQGRTGKK